MKISRDSRKRTSVFGKWLCYNYVPVTEGGGGGGVDILD